MAKYCQLSSSVDSGAVRQWKTPQSDVFVRRTQFYYCPSSSMHKYCSNFPHFIFYFVEIGNGRHRFKGSSHFLWPWPCILRTPAAYRTARIVPTCPNRLFGTTETKFSSQFFISLFFFFTFITLFSPCQSLLWAERCFSTPQKYYSALTIFAKKKERGKKMAGSDDDDDGGRGGAEGVQGWLDYCAPTLVYI